MKLNIYTDGSAMTLPDGKFGGWSFVITSDDVNSKVLVEKYGKLRTGIQDVNRAELEALYQAIKYMERTYPKSKFTIYTDCEAVRDCVLGKSKRKANRDIWDQIEPILRRKSGCFDIKSVKSHQYNDVSVHEYYNNRADALAKIGVNSLVVLPINIGIMHDSKDL